MDVFAPLQWLSDRLTYDLIGLSPDSHIGAAVNFFFYDVPKILLLLTVIVFVVSFVRSYFPPEKTRKYLTHKHEWIGNFIGAGVGVITPFCSCSAVPLFIGFIESGVPLGVTFSFLIASPLVDLVALSLLVALFGWKIAAAYFVSGIIVAVVGGFILGRLHLEGEIEEYVWKIRMADAAPPEMTRTQRARGAWTEVKDILHRVWLFVVIGIAIGGLMHGFVPGELLSRWAGPGNPFAVPIAVLFGIPLYSNVAGVIPVAAVLADKGVAIGTVIALLMATVGLSAPEFIILRKVMKPKLIAIFIAIGFTTITITGYTFNLLAPWLVS
ncbi:MAG: permease [Coriobacteriia bacterium]|nr:permease [Actinomycetota bacterium]MDZ4167616.1 permease [Coriobacteriia bacterium]